MLKETGKIENQIVISVLKGNLELLRSACWSPLHRILQARESVYNHHFPFQLIHHFCSNLPPVTEVYPFDFQNYNTDFNFISKISHCEMRRFEGELGGLISPMVKGCG